MLQTTQRRARPQPPDHLAAKALRATPPVARGSVLAIVVLMLPVMLALVALAVDVGRIMLVKDELRRAAEAGALAGASGLMVSGSVDWSGASQRALDAVTQNAAAGEPLRAAGVEPGYWDLATRGWGGSASFVPGTSRPTTGSWVPALRVTVARDGSGPGAANGGPVSLFFAPLFGRALQDASASAIAMQSAPGAVEPQTLLPLAINRCMFDLYWNSTTGTPVPVPSTSPFYNPADPYELRVGSQYQYGSCYSGQWNLFDTSDNSTTAVLDLLLNGNPRTMRVGDLTFIDGGVKAALYDSVIVNRTYLVAVVDQLDRGYQPIVAFAPFRVTRSEGGSTKAVFGRFVALSEFPGSLEPGGSIYYGTPAPPALVR
jgi:hypothetical protein